MVSHFPHALFAALFATTLMLTDVRAQGATAHISQQEVEFRQGLTPESWSKNTDGMPKCAVGSTGADLVEQKWMTDSLAGTVSLPKDFHEEPVSAGADGKRWIGADSTSIEIHGTHALYRGTMGMGGMDIGRPLGTTSCALALAGRAAPTHTLMLTRPVHGDTLYVDTPNTVVRNGVGLQFIVLTNSPAREARLLAVVQTLKLSPAKAP